jgi:hypothetical protein
VEINDVACELVRCGKASQGEKQKAYYDEAMKVLTLAVDRGLTDPAKTRADEDLAPLLGRQDFEALLARMKR